MKIAIGADHAGFELKEHIKLYLTGMGHQVEDYGTNSASSCDYPDIARPVAEAVSHGKAERGVLICGAGIGMSMAANKVKFVRAALCSEPYSARMSRMHNDANVLCMGARMIGIEMAEQILKEFLNTEFEGGRHQRRIDKIDG